MTHGDGVEGSFSENYKIILTMTPQLRPHGSKKGLLKNGQWHIIVINRFGQQMFKKGQTYVQWGQSPLHIQEEKYEFT